MFVETIVELIIAVFLCGLLFVMSSILWFMIIEAKRISDEPFHNQNEVIRNIGGGTKKRKLR